MKIRLYKGPFGGKVVDRNVHGEFVMRGPKKMTRKQEYEWFASQERFQYGYSYQKPQVEARYRPCRRPVQVGSNLANTILTHPDGSVFYEYVEGSRREFGS